MRPLELFILIHLSVSNPCHRGTVRSLVGYRCEPNDQRIYQNIIYHHCKIICLAYTCRYINFDASVGQCVIGNQVCIAVPANDRYYLDVFDSGNNECMTWLPYTTGPPPVGMVSMLTGARQQYVARIHLENMIIPAKIHPNHHHGLFGSVGTVAIFMFDAHNISGVEVLSIADCGAMTWKKYLMLSCLRERWQVDILRMVQNFTYVYTWNCWM